MLAHQDRSATLPPNEHQQRIYQHRAALHTLRADGRCLACERPVTQRGLVADFDPVGGVLRGVLCRPCQRKAVKVVRQPGNGEIVWAANSGWCFLVARYITDRCIVLDRHLFDEQVACRGCRWEIDRWWRLGMYLAGWDLQPVEPHPCEQPPPEPDSPTLLFLAPEPG